MTRGVTPYVDVENSNLLKHLKHGHRMPKPLFCPKFLKCWDKDPKLRPRFQELSDKLQTVITELEKV